MKTCRAATIALKSHVRVILQQPLPYNIMSNDPVLYILILYGMFLAVPLLFFILYVILQDVEAREGRDYGGNEEESGDRVGESARCQERSCADNCHVSLSYLAIVGEYTISWGRSLGACSIGPSQQLHCGGSMSRCFPFLVSDV